MTFEETMNSIRAQRRNLMRPGLAPSHVVFGFEAWGDFRKDARSSDVIDYRMGRAPRVMGLLVVFSEEPQEAKVLADGA